MATTGTGRVRLNLALDPRVHERILRVMEAEEIENVTELIRRALRLYDGVQATIAKGGRVIFEDKRGNQKDAMIF